MLDFIAHILENLNEVSSDFSFKMAATLMNKYPQESAYLIDKKNSLTFLYKIAVSGNSQASLCSLLIIKSYLNVKKSYKNIDIDCLNSFITEIIKMSNQSLWPLVR